MRSIEALRLYSAGLFPVLLAYGGELYRWLSTGCEIIKTKIPSRIVPQSKT
jgi:hypothetical protein